LSDIGYVALRKFAVFSAMVWITY